ncbi:hypothetical protein IF2G_10950 [Cordyceps javanica]|nr:hypothetical protein IF2G_10950 [Cordyceps javanica]
MSAARFSFALHSPDNLNHDGHIETESSNSGWWLRMGCILLVSTRRLHSVCCETTLAAGSVVTGRGCRMCRRIRPLRQQGPRNSWRSGSRLSGRVGVVYCHCRRRLSGDTSGCCWAGMGRSSHGRRLSRALPVYHDGNRLGTVGGPLRRSQAWTIGQSPLPAAAQER